MTDTKSHQIADAVRHIRRLTDLQPKIALILGSGLGSFADHLKAQAILKSSDIPHYPVGSVKGHSGRLLFGTIEDKKRVSLPLLLFQGRVHFYETGHIDLTVFPIELAHELGARILIVTNAAGGINSNFAAGQLMLIKHCFNFVRKYPVDSAEADPRKRFSTQLDPKLQDLVRKSARDLKINLQEGTYCWLHGPSYETVAEIKMLRVLGIDAVGMSTMPEIYKARSLGMKVVGISLISNLATGISATKLTHEEVTQTADKTQLSFSTLMKEIILRIS